MKKSISLGWVLGMGIWFFFIKPTDASTWYVSVSAGENGSGTNWVSAFDEIQEGIDAAAEHDVILVDDGLYDSGGKWVDGMNNRIAATNSVVVKSVHGPAHTIIVGAGPMGPSAVRCAYLSGGAELNGFTLKNGHTRTGAVGDATFERSGGGALVDGARMVDCIFTDNKAQSGGALNLIGGAVIIDCLVTKNEAELDGGGVYVDYSGILSNCHIIANEAGRHGGGVFFHYGGIAEGCTVSSNEAVYYGGAFFVEDDGQLNRCQLIGNQAEFGGGVNCNFGGTLNHCILAANHAVTNGGAVYIDNAGTFNHCTLTENTAGSDVGGVFSEEGGSFNNCIVWSNSPGNHFVTNGVWSTTCTTPLVGVNGITNAPWLPSAGDYRLTAGSDCIDAGEFLPDVMRDLEGTPMPLDGNADGLAVPDVGAYEFSSEEADTDRDTMSDFDEYVAATDGTDPEDLFRITAVSNGSVFFRSSVERHYTLAWRTNLTEGSWFNVQDAVPGTGDRLVLENTNAYATCFFKVMVEMP